MEAHTGKKHCENAECGLYQYVAKDLETLETHLIHGKFLKVSLLIYYLKI